MNRFVERKKKNQYLHGSNSKFHYHNQLIVKRNYKAKYYYLQIFLNICLHLFSLEYCINLRKDSRRYIYFLKQINLQSKKAAVTPITYNNNNNNKYLILTKNVDKMSSEDLQIRRGWIW